MENLCGILYETFRPLIIQMTHMETLAELCNILKVSKSVSRTLLYFYSLPIFAKQLQFRCLTGFQKQPPEVCYKES